VHGEFVIYQYYQRVSYCSVCDDDLPFRAMKAAMTLIIELETATARLPGPSQEPVHCCSYPTPPTVSHNGVWSLARHALFFCNDSTPGYPPG
jgi:hypothetical protein